MNKFIAVTVGDINGIGINIYLNILNKKKNNNFILFTNYELISEYLKKTNNNLKINIVNIFKEKIFFKKKYLNIFNFSATTPEENTFKSLKISYLTSKRFQFKGIVTLPLRKDLIIENLYSKFIGQTEYYQKLDKKEISNMILYHKKIIVCPLTTHQSIKSISKIVSKKNYIYDRILSLYNTLKYDFNINNPKILISGLNPHAGENGNIGQEEINIIEPSIKRIKKKNISITGPISADSMLIEKNLSLYDCFVFMYHDQALIPFKYISKFSGVNFTGNLDVIRVSPDHGTAYNLKNSKNVSDKSILNCFDLINQVSINRKFNDKRKSKKVLKSKLY